MKEMEHTSDKVWRFLLLLARWYSIEAILECTASSTRRGALRRNWADYGSGGTISLTLGTRISTPLSSIQTISKFVAQLATTKATPMINKTLAKIISTTLGT